MKRLLLAAAAGLLFCAAASAEYPEKPITIVVPFAAGGPTDKVARDLAEALRKPLDNQSIIIDNVGGAGGTLGAAKVARAAPDGYTLLLHHIGMATSPALYRKMTYDTLVDFEYLGMVNEVPMTIVGKPGLPANNYAELMKWLEANKGKINLANAGLGAASHLCGLLFQSTLKIDMQTVPYKGTAPAMNDLLGGQVDLMCDQTTNTTGQIAAKAIKAYAVTSTKRLTTPALKDLPTLDEAGLKGFNVTIWHAPLRAQGHAQGGAGQGQRRAARRPQGRRVHQARGSARRGDRQRRPGQRRRAQEVRRGRDQQVGAGHQGRRPVRRLIAPSVRATDRRLRAARLGQGAQRQRDRHRPVVDQVDLHVGAELAAERRRRGGRRR